MTPIGRMINVLSRDAGGIVAREKVSGHFPADLADPALVAGPFSWSVMDGAVSYDVYMDTANPPTTLVHDAQAAATYTPGTPLDQLTTYYWRVDWRDAVGVVTEGEVLSFTTGSVPGAFFLQSPADYSPGVPAYSVLLQWEAASGATSYTVYFGPSPDPGPVETGITEPWLWVNIDPYAIYYWRVVAHGTGGSVSSDEWDFSVTEP